MISFSTLNIEPADPIKRREATRDERLMMHTLRYSAAWDFNEIAKALGFANRTVARICGQTITPRKKHERGRKYKLTPTDRCRLFSIATQDSHHRRMPLNDIARICEIQVCDQVLRNAFQTQGYNRRVARRKPFLNQEQKAKRLAWALAHKD